MENVQNKAVFFSGRFPLVREGKTFQRGSNAGVNFFLAQVKCGPNFTLFCCKSELCRDFTLFWVTRKGFYFVFLKYCCQKRFFYYYYLIVASIDVWQSYFDHTCCQTHFTLFCREFTFVAIYAPSRVKQFLLKPCWGKKIVFFHVCP